MVTKKWTYEACYEEAKKYKTRGEFQKGNGSAYNVARQNDWLNDYDWFENGRKIEMKKRQIWTKEKCLEVALKCKTLKEFYTKYKCAYKNALKYGWIDTYTWFERTKSIETREFDNVYAYIFSDTIYIGRTVNIKERHEAHCTYKKDPVYKFAKQNNTPIPEMTVLESGLTLNEGLEKEDYYVKKYREEGWTVLNIAPTGIRSGSIGSLGEYKLTRKKCYEIALTCKTRGELQKKYQSVYNKVRKKGWLEDYDWFEESATTLKYTKEKCYEIALTCRTRGEFATKYPSAYNKSWKEGWLDEFKHLAPPKTRNKWPIDKIIEEANKYDNFKDFRSKSYKAYDAARKKNIISTIKTIYEKRA